MGYTHDRSGPQRMRGRPGEEPAQVDTHVTGNVARDGFERLAHRRHPGRPPPDESASGPFPMFGNDRDDKSIHPRIGEREYRYPRTDEE